MAIVNGITEIEAVVSIAFAQTINIPVEGSWIRREVRGTKHLLDDATSFPTPEFCPSGKIRFTAEKRKQMNFRMRKNETEKWILQ